MKRILSLACFIVLIVATIVVAQENLNVDALENQARELAVKRGELIKRHIELLTEELVSDLRFRLKDKLTDKWLFSDILTSNHGQVLTITRRYAPEKESSNCTVHRPPPWAQKSDATSLVRAAAAGNSRNVAEYRTLEHGHTETQNHPQDADERSKQPT
jgi:hypothetical protein